MSLLRTVLTSSPAERDSALAAMRRLHPQSLDTIPVALRERCASEHHETIEALMPLADGLGGDVFGDGCVRLREMLLRLVLAVRWNAFDSGLFLHQAIFNHAPSRVANADKAAVRVRGAESLGGGGGGGRVLSVVRATRHIPRGVQCVISYLQPAEISLAASARRLKTQFDFVAPCEPRHPLWDCPHAGQLPGGRAPVGSPSAEKSAPPPSVTTLGGAAAGSSVDQPAVSSATDAVSAGGAVVPNETTTANATAMEADDSEDAAVRRVENAAHREISRSLSSGSADVPAACAAVDRLVHALGEEHLGVACARRQLIEALRAQLQHGCEPLATPLRASAERLALVALLDHSMALWRTQRELLGVVHPECAVTLHDIGTALETLLARHATALCTTAVAARYGWHNVGLASRAAARALELHHAIAALYDERAIESALQCSRSAHGIGVL